MKKYLGLGFILIAVILVVIATKIDWNSLKPAPEKAPVNVTILYGGEKTKLLENPDVKKVFQEYRVTVNATKAGSIEMSTTMNVASVDCLWPSNQIAVQMAKDSGKTVLRSENIFNSPMVFYAWTPVTEALMKAKIVEKRSDSYYVVNTPKLLDMMIRKAPWSELGLPLYGPVRVLSTDPTKSNSGNIWAGLQANLRNGGDVVTLETLPKVLPPLKQYFDSAGMMETSSEDIFNNMVNQGMGSKPLIVGYENQLPQFILENKANPGKVQIIKEKINILYPEPTIYSSHPLISLTPQCGRLEEALKDPRIQEIAWREHGFRSGMVGVQNDPAVLGITGIPADINMVMPMPDAAVMEQILQALKPATK